MVYRVLESSHTEHTEPPSKVEFSSGQSGTIPKQCTGDYHCRNKQDNLWGPTVLWLVVAMDWLVGPHITCGWI